MQSILTSIKKMLGIMEDDESFDSDIIMAINTALSTLTQIGVGPSTGFFISDANSFWDDFISDDPKMEFVKSYVHLKVRLLFDPPSSSAVMESIKQMISELEWRIQVAAETTS